jgi:thiol-disulfide isomerase/thioredoxin
METTKSRLLAALKRWLVPRRIFDVLLLVLAAWALAVALGIIRTGGHLERGLEVPPLIVQAVPGGAPVALKGFLGKPVVLTFFSTSCPACRRELPDLDELAQKLAGRAVFLVVSQDPPEALVEYWRAEGLSLPLAFDNGEVHGFFKVTRIPYNVILDSAGRVYEDFLGPVRSADIPF